MVTPVFRALTSPNEHFRICLLGRFLSYPFNQNVRMKLNLLARLKHNEGEIMACFGEAKLIKRLTGKIELVGGTDADRAAAREWTSLFLHEAAI